MATAQKPITGPALEAAWHPFATRLALLPGVTVVPIFFHGENSRLFHLCSHINYSLRVALLFRESMRRTGGVVKVSIGTPQRIGAGKGANRADIARLMRRMTLGLGTRQPDVDAEFVWPRHIRFD